MTGPTRHHRERVIRRRLALASTWAEPEEPGRWTLWVYAARGYASKNATLCSCGLCRDEKYRNRPRARQHTQDLDE